MNPLFQGIFGSHVQASELKLGDFGIEIVTAVNPGPVITRFEVQPAPGVKSAGSQTSLRTWPVR